jgi:UPF0716 family protein affecting phage T7 exclusion
MMAVYTVILTFVIGFARLRRQLLEPNKNARDGGH